MAGFGQKLRQERESRNFTLAQVAEATRISLRYLEALESDNLAVLPGSVFNKGYVRSFAKFVGADPEPLVEAYVAEEEVQEREGRLSRPDVMAGLAQAAERDSRRRRAPKPGFRIPVLALLALALPALGAWSLFHFGFSSRDASPGVATNRKEAPSDPEPVEQTPTPSREARTSADRWAVPTVEPATAPPPESTIARQAAAREPATTSTPPPAAEREIASAKPDVPEPTERSHVSINDFGVGTGVVNRRLVGQSDRFDPGTRVWFWNRVIGGSKGENIRHVWMHEGKTVSSIELTLGGDHWRTQSRKTLRAPGRWSVEARDAENRVLARTEFVCAEPS